MPNGTYERIKKFYDTLPLIVVMIIGIIKTKGSVALSNFGKVFLLRTQWEEEEGGRVSAK